MKMVSMWICHLNTITLLLLISTLILLVSTTEENDYNSLYKQCGNWLNESLSKKFCQRQNDPFDLGECIDIGTSRQCPDGYFCDDLCSDDPKFTTLTSKYLLCTNAHSWGDNINIDIIEKFENKQLTNSVMLQEGEVCHYRVHHREAYGFSVMANAGDNCTSYVLKQTALGYKVPELLALNEASSYEFERDEDYRILMMANATDSHCSILVIPLYRAQKQMFTLYPILLPLVVIFMIVAVIISVCKRKVSDCIGGKGDKVTDPELGQDNKDGNPKVFIIEDDEEFKKAKKTTQEETRMDNNGGPVLRESNVGMLNREPIVDEEKGTFAEGPVEEDK